MIFKDSFLDLLLSLKIFYRLKKRILKRFQYLNQFYFSKQVMNRLAFMYLSVEWFCLFWLTRLSVETDKNADIIIFFRLDSIGWWWRRWRRRRRRQRWGGRRSDWKWGVEKTRHFVTFLWLNYLYGSRSILNLYNPLWIQSVRRDETITLEAVIISARVALSFLLLFNFCFCWPCNKNCEESIVGD